MQWLSDIGDIIVLLIIVLSLLATRKSIRKSSENHRTMPKRKTDDVAGRIYSDEQLQTAKAVINRGDIVSDVKYANDQPVNIDRVGHRVSFEQMAHESKNAEPSAADNAVNQEVDVPSELCFDLKRAVIYSEILNRKY